MKLLRLSLLSISLLTLLLNNNIYAASYTTKRISSNNYVDKGLQINNNGQIVWSGFDNLNYEIYLYSEGKINKITNTNYDNCYPQINDQGQIAWIGYTSGSHNAIFLYSEGNIKQITESSFQDISFQLNANGQLVWYGFDGNDYEIYIL